MHSWIFAVAICSAFALATSAVLPTPGSVVGIVKQTNDVNPDGSYEYSFESENGISVEETGHPSNLEKNPVVSSGSFKYTDPDGKVVSVEYVADENGFQPIAEHLPTPPPIPVYILRALEYIESHPEQSDE